MPPREVYGLLHLLCARKDRVCLLCRISEFAYFLFLVADLCFTSRLFLAGLPKSAASTKIVALAQRSQRLALSAPNLTLLLLLALRLTESDACGWQRWAWGA